MTPDDEELAKLLPNVKWPQTFEGKHGTHIKRTWPPKFPAEFSNPPITEDTIPPLSIGGLNSRVPTSRERMFDFINRTFYGDGGLGTEGNKYANRLMNFLDFTPVGTLNQAYDTGRALGEGRFRDASMSSGLAFLPALRKLPTGFHKPIPKPPRDVLKDFPNGAPVDAEGYVTQDVEGRPFDAPYKVGRTRLDEPDHALAPIDIQRVGEHAIEGPINKNSQDYFDSGVVGETWSFNGKPEYVHILDSLPQAEADMVTAHEVGHVIDQLAGQIPTDGLDKELNFVYNAMQTGKERKYLQNRPEDAGYRDIDVPREKMAETIRAYMIDPNYLKTVAPQAAARIRQYVNSHPQLSKIIQFNSLAAGATGLALAGQSDDSQAREKSKEVRYAQPNNVKRPYSSLGLPIPFNLMAGATREGAHGIARIANTLVRRGTIPAGKGINKFTPLARALMHIQNKKNGAKGKLCQRR